MATKLVSRAYTLRLSGTDKKNDQSWRDYLWQTHLAVNNGTKKFGDWLLTLRGGLSPQLAEKSMLNQPNKDIADSELSNNDKIWRRIILALSWLSVESKEGAPEQYIIEKEKLKSTLKEILEKRGLNTQEVAQWVKDCESTLSSNIRDDAVWVNRSAAFDDLKKKFDVTHEDLWDLLGEFLGDENSYFKCPKTTEEEEFSDTPYAINKEKDLAQKAVNWLSNRYGTGKGACFADLEKIYEDISNWAKNVTPNKTGDEIINGLATEMNLPEKGLDAILKKISGTGHKSGTRNLLKQIAEAHEVTSEDLEKLAKQAARDSSNCSNKKGKKGKKEYANFLLEDIEADCKFKYHDKNPRHAGHFLFAVMLDHAARRVSEVHTWVKKAEVRRMHFDKDSEMPSKFPQNVVDWLDKYCNQRSQETSSAEGYHIRRRALAAWKEIVETWAVCQTTEDRIAAVRSLQDDPEIKKFGDAQLFEALATEDAIIVWNQNGKPDPDILIEYAKVREAQYDKKRFKVPAYNHPHHLKHPVFCDFGNSRWDIDFAMQGKGVSESRVLEMELFDGQAIKKTKLMWHSKRLARDIGLKHIVEKAAIPVVRNDRMGRATAGLQVTDSGIIKQLFDQKYWNGRLQAPRDELNKIAYYEDKGQTDKSAKLRNNIHWLLSFSAKLEPCPQWHNQKEYTAEIKKKLKDYTSANKKRGSKTRFIIPRIPGIRILSVDLGHRYAAACAVWELLNNNVIISACKQAGHTKPGVKDIYLYLDHNGRKTIYRRIGQDDNNAAMASWARLDRQFLIKLQGEEHLARRASDAELNRFNNFSKELGYQSDQINSSYIKIDELMSATVELARVGIGRHSRKAKIAFNLQASYNDMPRGSKQKLDNAERREPLLNALMDWYALSIDNKYNDQFAKDMWKKHIVPVSDNIRELSSKTDSENTSTSSTKNKTNRTDDKLQAELTRVACLLKEHDINNMVEQWTNHWEEEDASWKKRLRWIRDWIMPRGKAGTDKSNRNIGGLSLTRIANMQSLYRVEKAFANRPRPEDPRANVPVVGDKSHGNFGKRILEDMEHLRENRVKQIASRIVEAALGIGIEEKRNRGNSPKKRPLMRLETTHGQRFAACDAVIIENLRFYRPDQMRTRRENRQLMNWSAAKIHDYLSDICELNGLYLKEVAPAYTSRQDSRTGAPGLRCRDIAVTDFIAGKYGLSEKLTRIRKKKAIDRSAEERLLLAYETRWKEETKQNGTWQDGSGNTWKMQDGKWREKNGVELQCAQSPEPVRLPWAGGDIFVSADCNSPAAGGIQADLNAAANIGLQAVLDPDWSGRWWYVPCSAKDFKPVEKYMKGSPCFGTMKNALIQKPPSDERTQSGNDVINLWRKLDTENTCGHGWMPTKSYWKKVAEDVVDKILLPRVGV